MIFINCEQGTDAWFAARAGVVTASMFSTACDVLKPAKGETGPRPSQKNIDYAYKVAIERIYGGTTEDVYQTFEMRRGTELEPYARMSYESISGNLALEAGIVLTDDKIFGYSTDGFVDEDGIIEVKCPNSARKICQMHIEADLSEYIHQIQGGLWITGRLWCDFIMYAPQLENVGKQLFIKRIVRDDDFIEKMESQLWVFEQRVQTHLEILNRESA